MITGVANARQMGMLRGRIIGRGSSTDPASECTVCGDPVPAGSGFTARAGERDFRFKCAECLARFEADPAPYLAADQRLSFERGDEESPASEWTCY